MSCWRIIRAGDGREWRRVSIDGCATQQKWSSRCRLIWATLSADSDMPAGPSPVTKFAGPRRVYFTLVHSDNIRTGGHDHQRYYSPTRTFRAQSTWCTTYQETLQSLGGQGEYLPGILKERMLFEKRYIAAMRDPAARRLYRAEFLDANLKEYPALGRVRDNEIIAKLNVTPDRVMGGPVSKSTRSGSGGGRSSSGQRLQRRIAAAVETRQAAVDGPIAMLREWPPARETRAATTTATVDSAIPTTAAADRATSAVQGRIAAAGSAPAPDQADSVRVPADRVDSAVPDRADSAVEAAEAASAAPPGLGRAAAAATAIADSIIDASPGSRRTLHAVVPVFNR
jgi:hypothetical protein